MRPTVIKDHFHFITNTSFMLIRVRFRISVNHGVFSDMTLVDLNDVIGDHF